MTALLVAVVLAALFFDFTNGFHDAANAIGTSISTRALAPTSALALAAVLEFAGALLSTHIAMTVCTGIVVPSVVTLPMLLSGLLAAIAWNLTTWYFGIPSSSSHCLFGGIAGAVLFEYGASGVRWAGIAQKVVIPTVVSPVLGLVAGCIFNMIVLRAARRMTPTMATSGFRGFQLLSASGMALSHGLNDAQKTMGIITLALLTSHVIPRAEVPLWVKLACAVVMALGTFSGGKRIIKTVGSKITKLTPSDGFSAQTAGAGVLQLAAYFGLPVSTTHVITASIMGVGATRNVRAVRWGVTRSIGVAWVLTLPVSAVIGASISAALHYLGPLVGRVAPVASASF